MGKTLQYVKEFDFSGAGKAVGGKCATPKAKYAAGGRASAVPMKQAISPRGAAPVGAAPMREPAVPMKQAAPGRGAAPAAIPDRRRDPMIPMRGSAAPVRGPIPTTMMKKGGPTAAAVKSAKIGKVMSEYKAGELHSGKNGPIVKNPKQAIAISMSEARRAVKKP